VLIFILNILKKFLKKMKNNLYKILIISILCSNCGSKKETVTTEKDDQHTTSELLVRTSEQLKNTGIELGTPEFRSLNTMLDCTGRIELPPQHLISVHSKVAGFIRKVNYYSGEYVKKGVLLAIVENTEFVEKQRELLETKTKLYYAEREYNRRKSLSQGDAIAQKDVQQAEAEYQNLKTLHSGLQKELEVYGFNVAQIESIEQFQTQLSIFCPQSGYITQVNTNLGKKVHPDDELYQIIDKSDVHIELQVFAIDIPKVKENQRVTFHLAGSEQVFQAEVHTIGSMIDEQTKTVNIHCHLKNDNDAKYLTTGTFINANIETGVQNSLTLPNEAFVKEGDDYFVYVQKDVKGTQGFEKTKVETNLLGSSYRAVKGIAPKTQVVVKGAYYME
jgi:membrane fusion protein, heavy metal efflux system